MRIGQLHLERFKSACEKLIHMAGMVHYTRSYRLAPMEDLARIDVDFDARHVEFLLFHGVLKPIEAQIFKSPEHMAIHEVGHFINSTISFMAENAGVDLAENEDELFAQRFENMLCQLLTPQQIEALGNA